ncbi:MAG: hypothetical protein CL917_08030 [Deltaproteobacteria bacterium]|nr:hypothetical protein [Deltaproteobacteria bacterium]
MSGTRSQSEFTGHPKQGRLERDLEAVQGINRDLLDAFPEVIVQCDAENRPTYLNPAWQKLLGYPVSESLGQPLTHFLVSADMERWTGFLDAGMPDRTI